MTVAGRTIIKHVDKCFEACKATEAFWKTSSQQTSPLLDSHIRSNTDYGCNRWLRQGRRIRISVHCNWSQEWCSAGSKGSLVHKAPAPTSSESSGGENYKVCKTCRTHHSTRSLPGRNRKQKAIELDFTLSMSDTCSAKRHDTAVVQIT